MSGEPFIEVHDLTIGWDDYLLLEGASFQVGRGEVFAILGGSGCGKSTLLRYLVGLELPSSGHIAVDGEPLRALRAAAPSFGMMFQSGALFGSLTIGENVALPLEKWTQLPEPAIDVIVRSKLDLVGLRGFEDHTPAQISGGMKKRAAIARAMALEPSLLFLDEPSAGLDPVSAVELDELILTLSSALGITVVMVSHELESIFKVANSCIMLDKASKSIIARGDPRTLRDQSSDPRVHSFFNRKGSES